MDEVDDITNITGIAQLLDYNGSEDLSDLEKKMIEGSGSADKKTSRTEVEQFKEHLNKLGTYIGAPTVGGIDEEDDEEEEDEDEESGSSGGSRYNSDDNDDSRSTARGHISHGSNFEYSTYHKATEEQKKQDVVSNVMRDMHHSSDAFQIEKEIESDDKAILLEDIDKIGRAHV